jgi:hypothetical protein
MWGLGAGWGVLVHGLGCAVSDLWPKQRVWVLRMGLLTWPSWYITVIIAWLQEPSTWHLLSSTSDHTPWYFVLSGHI